MAHTWKHFPTNGESHPPLPVRGRAKGPRRRSVTTRMEEGERGEEKRNSKAHYHGRLWSVVCCTYSSGAGRGREQRIHQSFSGENSFFFFFPSSEALFPPLFSQFPVQKKSQKCSRAFPWLSPPLHREEKKMLLLLLAAWSAVAAVTARDFLSPLSEAINYSGAGREGNGCVCVCVLYPPPPLTPPMYTQRGRHRLLLLPKGSPKSDVWIRRRPTSWS